MPRASQSLINACTVGAAVVLLLSAPDAKAQSKGDAGNRPTFQDDRRWAPKPEPALTAPGGPAHAVAPKPTQPDPAIKQTGNASCGDPAAKPTPLEAGRMRIVVNSSCRSTQEIVWTYGGGEFAAKLDTAGRAELIVDAFAGTTSPVEIKFADQTILSLTVEALELDKVSKIAVIWRASVNLDLHAFEYAALPGQAGHVSAAAPSSLPAAREWIEKSARGHGFLSTKSADGPRDRLEVYTFLHKDGQTSGLVTTALDHETRGEQPQPAQCGKGEHAEVAFRVVTWSRQGHVTREPGVIAAAECGRDLPQAARLNPAALPTIRIRN